MRSTRQQRERQCVSHAQTWDEAVARKSSDVTEGQRGQPRPCVTTQGLCLARVEGVTFSREQMHVPKAGRPKGGHANTRCYLWQVTPRPCAGTVTLERVSMTGWVSVCSGCHSEGWQNGRLINNRNLFSPSLGREVQDQDVGRAGSSLRVGEESLPGLSPRAAGNRPRSLSCKRMAQPLPSPPRGPLPGYIPVHTFPLHEDTSHTGLRPTHMTSAKTPSPNPVPL